MLHARRPKQYAKSSLRLKFRSLHERFTYLMSTGCTLANVRIYKRNEARDHLARTRNEVELNTTAASYGKFKRC